MKKFNLSFLVALVVMVSLFMTSCERTEIMEEIPSTEETLRFAKEVTITDNSGLNTVILHVESDNEEVLEDYQASTYELIAFFEVPPANLGAKAIDDSSIGTLISVKSTTLQEGVVFYKLVKIER